MTPTEAIPVLQTILDDFIDAANERGAVDPAEAVSEGIVIDALYLAITVLREKEMQCQDSL